MTRCCHCGATCESPLENCPACGALATLLPFEVSPPAAAELSQDAGDIEGGSGRPIPTGFEPWDEALGGGLMLGSERFRNSFRNECRIFAGCSLPMCLAGC